MIDSLHSVLKADYLLPLSVGGVAFIANMSLISRVIRIQKEHRQASDDLMQQVDTQQRLGNCNFQQFETELKKLAEKAGHDSNITFLKVASVLTLHFTILKIFGNSNDKALNRMSFFIPNLYAVGGIILRE